MITRDQLLELHKQLCDRGYQILRSKNVDYSAGQDDPFANLKNSIIFGVKPEIGILIRCMDKMKRVQAFVDKGELKERSESVTDCAVDIINYMVLLIGMIDDRPTGK